MSDHDPEHDPAVHATLADEQDNMQEVQGQEQLAELVEQLGTATAAEALRKEYNRRRIQALRQELATLSAEESEPDAGGPDPLSPIHVLKATYDAVSK